MRRARSRSPVRNASYSASDSAGNAFVSPDTQPFAPSTRPSKAMSSRPANSVKRSPNALIRSVKRRGSGEDSLMQTIFGTSARRASVSRSMLTRYEGGYTVAQQRRLHALGGGNVDAQFGVELRRRGREYAGPVAGKRLRHRFSIALLDLS